MAGLLSDPLLLYLSGTAALKLALSYYGYKKRPVTAERVGTVSAILLYPVKSMQGISLQEATCTFTGTVSGDVADR